MSALATLLSHPAIWRGGELGRVAAPSVPSGYAGLDAELPGGGWPAAALTEILPQHEGIGELRILGHALAALAAQGRWLAWIAPPYLPYAPALAAAGIDLTRALFVQPETPREALWAIEQSLRAAHLGALVGWLPQAASREGAFRALRRLQLLASRKPAPVFLLREARARHSPSPAALRLQLAASDGTLRVEILKRRGRPLLEPVVLQVHPTHWQAQARPAAAGIAASRPQPAGMLRQVALMAQRWSTQAIGSH